MALFLDNCFVFNGINGIFCFVLFCFVLISAGISVAFSEFYPSLIIYLRLISRGFFPEGYLHYTGKIVS